jgi:PTH1 family peptidyl-tRNA hydrolase
MGLGNPGPKYQDSRHNVGYRCLELLARRYAIQVDARRRYVVTGQGDVDGSPVLLARPRIFMNESGMAVGYLRDRYGITPAQLLVIADDMDLPLGKLRLRPSGGTGGHRGLGSIQTELESQDFPRLRVGIGRPGDAGGAIDHVLSRFSADEAPLVTEAVERAVEAVEVFLAEGVQEAMNQFN